MSFYTRLIFALLAMSVSSIANAHPGFESGIQAGLAHPWLGLDHLLAMLAIGIWAYQLKGRAMLLLPVSFISVMAVFGILGVTGLSLPIVESAIATSVLLVGLLITFSIKIPALLATIIVGLFAVFHGYAHGIEIPPLDSFGFYVGGFLLSSLILLAIGISLGFVFDKKALWLRILGALITSSGAWMMFSM